MNSYLYNLLRKKRSALVLVVLLSSSLVVPCWASSGFNLGMSTGSVWMQSTGSATLTVTASPYGGLKASSSSTAKITSGLPSGISASWSQPSVSSSGSVSWVLTLTGSDYALGTVNSLAIGADLYDSKGNFYYVSNSVTLTVFFMAPTLKLSCASSAVSVKQGGSVSNTFQFTGGGSFHGPISVSVTGLPSGMTASWTNSPVSLSSGSAYSTLTLSAGNSTPVNWFLITVVASGDGVSSSKQFTVKVGPATGFQVQMSYWTLAVQPKGTATVSITAQPVHGVTVPSNAAGASAAITSSLPAGITASLSAPKVTSAGAVNWTLTLAANSSVQVGTDPISMSVSITDATRGLVYSSSPSFTLLVSLVAAVDIGDVSIDGASGISIPPDFMGLSEEWWDAAHGMGSAETGVNWIYRQLLSNLTAYGSDPVNIRVGGESTDTSGAPTSTSTQPFAELTKAMGNRFELGVNLGADNVNLATTQATAYLSQMPQGSVTAIEIGNEPDLYARNGYRPPTYTVDDYFSDFAKWKNNIIPATPSGTKLMGPAWGSAGMLGNSSTFLAQNATAVAVVSQHYYVTGPNLNPAQNILLQSWASTTEPEAIAPAVALAHAKGLTFRMGEFNSIYDGGTAGISNAFGSALWAIDTMFELANVGADGVNWEAGGGNYCDPFLFTTNTSKGITSYGLSTVRPLYYGLLFFQAATANGSQLVPVDLKVQANMKAWATIDSSGTPRLAVINKDNTYGTIAITVSGYNKASIIRLRAPSYTATSGVTLGGQTFDGSTDGTIQGTQSSEVTYGSNGLFHIWMPGTSAALLVFSK